MISQLQVLRGAEAKKVLQHPANGDTRYYCD